MNMAVLAHESAHAFNYDDAHISSYWPKARLPTTERPV